MGHFTWEDRTVNVEMKELGEQAVAAARNLGEQAVHLAVEAWDRRPDVVDDLAGKVEDLAEKARDLEVPEPIEHAIDTARRRPWAIMAGFGAMVLALVAGKVWLRRRAERRQLAHLGADDARRDPFGDARYQERAVAAAS